jgi:agmatine deiminase
MKKSSTKTPAALSYRMPAEWEAHEATWLVWPHHQPDWPGKMETLTWFYGELIRKLAQGEAVNVLCNNATDLRAARDVVTAVGADAKRVELLACPTERGWLRDSGPLFLRKGGARPELAISRFRFNAWALFRDWKKDAALPDFVARRTRVPVFPALHNGKPVVLEGGAIDVNGRGSLLTTEQCLLDQQTQVRNPGLGKAELEQIFRDNLGVGNTIWLKHGIAGRDDTHGHVDDICRFVRPGTVVLCQEKFRGDENYRRMAENRERLEGARLENGSRLEIIPLPMPEPLYFRGVRLPATYANFYIGNAAVLVPTFNDPKDREALGILGELFRDRPVVGLHAVDVVLGSGAIHCLTQQQPAR